MSHPSPDRSVVITGIGLFSPIGIGREAFWESLAAKKSGIGPSTVMSGTSMSIGGEVPGFDAKTAKKDYLKAQRKNVKVMCRDIQLGVASALQAMADSGLAEGEIPPERIGVDFGANLMLSPPDELASPAKSCADDTSSFEFDRWGDEGLTKMFPLWLLMYLPNMPACHIAITLDARGPSNSLTLDEPSGNVAMSEAMRIIARGQADMMISGSTGTRLHPVKSIHVALYSQIATTSDDAPETWSRPFSTDRFGQVLSEGAGTFILEAKDSAESRDATIYGTLVGTGSSCVISKTGEPNLKQALVNSMRAAIRDAGVSPEDIGHINAGAPGIENEDRAEAEAIHEIFGERGATIPVTALKSYFGNSGSGCGPQELAGSLLALREGLIPATLNYSQPDDAVPLNIVYGEHQPTENMLFLKTNVNQVGQASAVVVRAEPKA